MRSIEPCGGVERRDRDQIVRTTTTPHAVVIVDVDGGGDGGGGGSIPSTATPVHATLGNTHAGISQMLPPAAALSGTVTENGTGTPVGGGQVKVFDAAGVEFAAGSVSSSGHYAVKALPAGTAAWRGAAMIREPKGSISRFR